MVAGRRFERRRGRPEQSERCPEWWKGGRAAAVVVAPAIERLKCPLRRGSRPNLAFVRARSSLVVVIVTRVTEKTIRTLYFFYQASVRMRWIVTRRLDPSLRSGLGGRWAETIKREVGI